MQPSAAKSTPADFRARLAFVLGTTAGLLAFASLPWLQRKLGIFDFGRWFLDSLAVLAASDAVQEGINVERSNPLDVLNRPHSYSDWWFALADIGLTREDNFLIGGAWVLGFLLISWVTLRPRTLGHAVILTLLLLSPPILLAIIRANNDLLVFVLLGLAAIAARLKFQWSWIPVLLPIAVATGLKFYPVVAAGIFILFRPLRRATIAIVTSSLVLGLVLADVWSSLGRGTFTLPQALYTFGAPVLFRDLNFPMNVAGVVGAGILTLLGLRLVSRGVAYRSNLQTAGWNHMLFTLGSFVLLACFVAGTSYSYRCIFALWLVPWLLDQAGSAAASLSARKAARTALLLVGALMWADGIFCLVLNIVVGPMQERPREMTQLIWRLVTQPFVWALMVMLTAWLLDAVRCLLSDYRTIRAINPTPVHAE